MPAADVRHGKETRRHYAAVVLQNQNRFVMDPIKILNSSQIDHIFPVKDEACFDVEFIPHIGLLLEIISKLNI